MIKFLEHINESEPFYIYMLTDKIGDPLYIGITKNVKERYRKHLNEKSITLKNNWIKSLLVKGEKPIMVIIDYANDRVEANKKEKQFISDYKNLGFNLKNMTNGGDGGETMTGRKLTSEQRNKISKSKIGKKQPFLIEFNKSKRKVVYQIDPITKSILRSFDSVKIASEITGCSKTNISKFANGSIKKGCKTVGGYEWRY